MTLSDTVNKLGVITTCGASKDCEMIFIEFQHLFEEGILVLHLFMLERFSGKARHVLCSVAAQATGGATIRAVEFSPGLLKEHCPDLSLVEEQKAALP